MGKFEIWVYSNKKEGNYKEGYKSLNVKVTKEEHFDKLSKRFNKFTHTIQYSGESYIPSDFYLTIYDPNPAIYRYLLKYNSPAVKVISVDFFFQSSDKSNYKPLVIGIKDYGGITTYYTYNFLIGYTSGSLFHKVKNHVLPHEKKFYSDDLLTRLLEELGLHRTDRANKLVFKLNYKSTSLPVTYPSTGLFPKKITLSKKSGTPLPFYDEYEHVVDPKISGSSCYLTYDRNSLFIQGDKSFKKLTKFCVYHIKHGPTKPIFIVLFSDSSSKLYKFSDFENDLKSSDPSKNVSALFALKQNGLTQHLIDEYDRLFERITFLIDKKENGYSPNVNVDKNTDSRDYYSIYDHVPKFRLKSARSTVIFKNEIFKIKGGGVYNKRLNKMSSYFLKNIKGEEDSIPFLVAFTENQDDLDHNFDSPGQIYFYTKSKDSDQKWMRVTLDFSAVVNILIEKIDKPSSDDFSKLRQRAHLAFFGHISTSPPKSHVSEELYVDYDENNVESLDYGDGEDEIEDLEIFMNGKYEFPGDNDDDDDDEDEQLGSQFSEKASVRLQRPDSPRGFTRSSSYELHHDTVSGSPGIASSVTPQAQAQSQSHENVDSPNLGHIVGGTTVGVVGVGATGGVVLYKFPYLIIPSMKPLV